MNILMLTTRFPLEPSGSWLTRELAEEFVRQGHRVYVIALDWNSKYEERVYEIGSLLRVFNFRFRSQAILEGIPKLRQLSKWFSFSTQVQGRLPEEMATFEPDLIISFSPAVAARSLLERFLTNSNIKRLLIQWDFFPIHHVELGLIPPLLAPVLRRMELRQMNLQTHIACMSPRNVEFLRENYRLKDDIKTLIIPVWGPNSLIERADSKRGKVFSCIFGGQLSAGRGLDILIDLARRSRNVSNEIQFLVAGDGPLRDWLEKEIADSELTNVRYLGSLSREEYYARLKEASVGLVLNSMEISAPSFPSKSIDYFRAALPVLAAVESASDYGGILRDEIRGGFCSNPQDREQLFQDLIKLYENPALCRELGENGKKYYLENMIVERVVDRITKDLSL